MRVDCPHGVVNLLNIIARRFTFPCISAFLFALVHSYAEKRRIEWFSILMTYENISLIESAMSCFVFAVPEL